MNQPDYASGMRNYLFLALGWMLCFHPAIQAASKPHIVAFGKPTTVKLFVDENEARSTDMKVRPLYVDGKLKEFTTGEEHDITDRQFTVQRAFRVNDSLPQDGRALSRWRWQRGGWLLVDRSTGRISPIRLPDFDPFYSDAAWYRDYAAYCGISDGGEKLYAMVAQLGVRKALLQKYVRPANAALTDPECGRPKWQRQPTRVTFDLKDGQQFTFTLRGRTADISTPDEPSGAEEESN
jgi:hypothetical protein